jgi:hypothetical protein
MFGAGTRIGLFSPVENAWADCFREADFTGLILDSLKLNPFAPPPRSRANSSTFSKSKTEFPLGQAFGTRTSFSRPQELIVNNQKPRFGCYAAIIYQTHASGGGGSSEERIVRQTVCMSPSTKSSKLGISTRFGSVGLWLPRFSQRSKVRGAPYFSLRCSFPIPEHS